MTLEQFKNSHCECEEQAALANAYDDAVVKTIPMGTAYFLANATMQHGYSAVSHNSLAKVCRSSPRKIGKAIQALIENGFVSYEGRADNGAPIYRAVWERAELHRIWANANYEAQHKALRTNTEFVPPTYPQWEQKRKSGRRKSAELALRRLNEDADGDRRLTDAARKLYRKIVTSYNWELGYADCSDSFVTKNVDTSHRFAR